MKIPKTVYFFSSLWVIAFALSFIAPQWIEPIGDGFTRGLNRIGAFLIWQLTAFVLAVLLFFAARIQLKAWHGKRWIFHLPLFVHLFLIVLVVGAILFARFNKPSPLPAEAKPVTAPAVEMEAASTVTIESEIADEPEGSVLELLPVETYRGIYRSGFEMSHFYTMDGEGPWWLEAEGDVWQRLQAFYVEAPGRGGGITVALTVTAYLEEVENDLAGVGDLQHRIRLVSIESIRGITTEEFELILQAVMNVRGN